MRLGAIVVGLALIGTAALANLALSGVVRAETVLIPAALSAPYEPREHDFSLAFPGQPKVGFKVFADGSERTYMDNQGSNLFMATASSFLLGAKADDASCNRRLGQFAKVFGAALTSKRPVVWGGVPGWEATFTSPGGDLILVRMTVHDKRLYQAIYRGEGPAAIIQGRQFMESFRLLNHPMAVPAPTRVSGL